MKATLDDDAGASSIGTDGGVRRLLRTHMSRPSEDDRESVDRAFAELMASYHLTSDRPDPLARTTPAETTAAETAAETISTAGAAEPPDTVWADTHPLFRYVEAPEPDEPPEPEERFVPPPPAPLPKPAWPVLVALIAMGYCVLTVLAVVLGARLPSWAGWLAIVGFVGAFALLVIRLPRHRPPDAGDGAVL